MTDYLALLRQRAQKNVCLDPPDKTDKRGLVGFVTPPQAQKNIAAGKGADAGGAFCVRWCEAALAAGVPPEVIERLPDAELELYRQHFETCADWYAAAQAAARMLRDSATMADGRVPFGWTAAAICQHCGPVWIAPSIAALLDVADGWPTAPGCPWCHVTMPKGHRLPRPSKVSG